MYLGNIWSALLNWLSVRKADGLLLLRIEDIDAGRCRPAYTAQLMEDLSSLGLNWDESPAHPVLRQQERLDIYGALLADCARAGTGVSLRLLPAGAPGVLRAPPEDGHSSV
jgi:glutamyl-tRNA synthetase